MEQSGSEVSGVKSSYIGEHDVLGDDFGDCETEMRELSILLLQTHVYSSFDDISSAEQVCGYCTCGYGNAVI